MGGRARQRIEKPEKTKTKILAKRVSLIFVAERNNNATRNRRRGTIVVPMLDINRCNTITSETLTKAYSGQEAVSRWRESCVLNYRPGRLSRAEKSPRRNGSSFSTEHARRKSALIQSGIHTLPAGFRDFVLAHNLMKEGVASHGRSELRTFRLQLQS